MDKATKDVKVTSLTDEQIDAMPRGERHKAVLRMLRAHQQVTSKEGWTRDEALKTVVDSRERSQQ